MRLSDSLPWRASRARHLVGAAIFIALVGVVAAPAAAQPAAPTGIKYISTQAGNPGTYKVNMSWDAVGGAVQYQHAYGTSAATAASVAYPYQTATTGTVYNLSPGTTYYFCVRASNGTWGPWSAAVPFTTNGIVVPTATPVPLTAPALSVTGATSTSVSLSWTPVNNAVGYGVYAATDPGFTTNLRSTYNSVDTRYTYSGLASGVTWYFRVNASPTGSPGPFSATVSAVTVNPPPATVTPTPIPTWVQQAAGATFLQASISSSSIYGGIITGSQHYAFNGVKWGIETYLDQVSYCCVDGSRWGVLKGAITRRSSIGSWVNVPGTLKEVSAGGTSNVWGVNAGGYLLKWNGTAFVQQAGTGWASVAAAADGTVWALKTNDSIWRLTATGWVQVAGGLRWIAVGSSTNVWGVNATGSVYKYNFATGTWDLPAVPPGAYKGVGTAADSSTVLVRTDGTLWKK